MPLPDYVQHFQGQPVLITGGLGFIGSNLARRLADLGAQVTVLDSLHPQYGGNLFNINGYDDRLAIKCGDMREPHTLNNLVQRQAFIFNLAGQVSHLDSMQDPFTDLEINCRSQLFLLQAVQRYNAGARIVFASTRQVYGRPQSLPVSETHPLAPVDINGIHKQAGEWYHTIYHQAHGLRTTSLRLTNTYGPRMRVVDARQTFLGLWIRQILSGEEIVVFGDGQQKRDLTFVDDAVDALLRSAVLPQAEGGIYNVGAPDPVSLLDLARILIRINGSGTCRLEPFPPARQAIDIGDYYTDFSRIERALDWHPLVTLEEGLQRTLAYYRGNRKYYW